MNLIPNRYPNRLILAFITVLACRHTDGKFVTHPGPETLIEPDGILQVLGTRQQLRDMKRFAGGI